MMETAYTLSIMDSRAVLEAVGGKGASLARLAGLGLPVPDGFHVTTAAYERFVEANMLKNGIEAALEGVSIDLPASLEVASEAIFEMFAQANMPEEIARAITLAYDRLKGGNPAVAVRSSATAEDLPELSFADDEFSILQARPITTWPQIEEANKIEWKPPDPKGQYLRSSAVDLMPGPLSPLFESIGLPALISGVNRLARRLTRSEPALPKDYFTTINSFAYGNTAFPPGAWWWIITGLLPAYPRILRIAVPFWKEEALPEYRELLSALSSPIGGLLLLGCLGTIGTSNFESIFGMYALQALDYDPEQVGLILTVVGFVAVIGRGVLTGLFTRRWGEEIVIKGALLSGALAFILLLLAQNYLAVLLTAGLFVLITAFFRPAVHSLTSQRATVGQGAAMGLSNSFVSLGRVIGPICAGLVFDLDSRYPYLCGATILLVVFFLSLVWMPKLRQGPAAGSPV